MVFLFIDELHLANGAGSGSIELKTAERVVSTVSVGLWLKDRANAPIDGGAADWKKKRQGTCSVV